MFHQRQPYLWGLCLLEALFNKIQLYLVGLTYFFQTFKNELANRKIGLFKHEFSTSNLWHFLSLSNTCYSFPVLLFFLFCF